MRPHVGLQISFFWSSWFISSERSDIVLDTGAVVAINVFAFLCRCDLWQEHVQNIVWSH